MNTNLHGICFEVYSVLWAPVGFFAPVEDDVNQLVLTVGLQGPPEQDRLRAQLRIRAGQMRVGIRVVVQVEFTRRCRNC